MTTSLQQFQTWLGAVDEDEVPYYGTDPFHPFWYDNDVSPMMGGSVSTDEGALRVAAFLACVRVLSESIAGLPCKLYQRNDDGTKEEARQHGQWTTLHETPDGLMTAFEFWELVVTTMILRGNLPARAISGPRGPNTVIKWIHPDRASKSPPITEMSDGSWRFYYKDEDDEEVYLSTARNDFFHVKGMTLDGMWGLSPLTLLRLQLESADKSRKYGNRFWDNGLTPTGTMESDQALSDKAFARLKSQMDSRSGWRQAHKTLILEDGLKFNPIAMSHEDAQFLDLRKFDKAEIAGVLRVPLHMIADLERSTNNNIEHQSLEFVVHSLRPWLRRIEEAIKLRLILRPNVYYAEFLIDALLRGDIKSRYEAYAKGIENLFLNADEVRAMENLNPREDGKGDEYKNPHINPEQPKPQNPDAQKQSSIEASQPFRRPVAVFAKDIGGRIALAAHKDVKGRVKHAKEDPDRFAGWLVDYLNGHAQHIDNMIGPFCSAFDVQDAHKTECVTKIVEASGSRLKADPKGALGWLEEGAAGTFECLIKELVT